jgi:hypothetical protein
MRQKTLRRLEALEKEECSRQQEELSSLRQPLVYIWKIVLAYYLGGLKSDEEDPRDTYARALDYRFGIEIFLEDAHARALNYQSGIDFFHAVVNKDLLEIRKRYNDAYRRLFASVGLDLDSAPPSVLFDAFVTLVNQLPEPWLNWLKSNLQKHCPHAETDAGSNIPRWLSGGDYNFFLWAEPTCCIRTRPGR